MTAAENFIDLAEDELCQARARPQDRRHEGRIARRCRCFMLEAVQLTFGVEDPEAARLAQRWKEETFRLLDADYITHSADGRPKVVRLLRPVSRNRLMNGTSLVRELIA